MIRVCAAAMLAAMLTAGTAAAADLNFLNHGPYANTPSDNALNRSRVALRCTLIPLRRYATPDVVAP